MAFRRTCTLLIVPMGLALAACSPNNVVQEASAVPPTQTMTAAAIATAPAAVPTTVPTQVLTATAPAAAPTRAPATAPTATSVNPSALGKDPKDATFTIETQAVTLINGKAEQPVAPGSASKQVTTYFGNEVELDLNLDGQPDVAFLLTQSSGGSGTFFYVVAALNTADGYQGTNAIFLGDRIAPQSTNVDPRNPAQFVVNYADRKVSDPMSAPPSVGVSRTFRVDHGTLVEVGTPPTPVP